MKNTLQADIIKDIQIFYINKTVKEYNEKIELTKDSATKHKLEQEKKKEIRDIIMYKFEEDFGNNINDGGNKNKKSIENKGQKQASGIKKGFFNKQQNKHIQNSKDRDITKKLLEQHNIFDPNVTDMIYDAIENNKRDIEIPKQEDFNN